MTVRSAARTPMQNRVLRWSLVLFVLTVAVSCDQVTKRMARESLLTQPSISFFSDAVRLEYAENSGGFLSFGAELPSRVRSLLFVGLVAAILAVALGLALRQGRAPATTLQIWGLSLLAGGGAGNLIDRLVHDGRVVDFINLGLGSLRTGVFNVADVAVTLGVTLLAISGLRPSDSPFERKSRSMEDLQYPLGRLAYPQQPFTAEERRERIATIAGTPERLRAAVAGLTDVQLDTPYRPGGWTVRQLVHHLPDSHINAYVRFKRALTEESPTVRPYDENAWAVLPDAQGGPIAPALDLLAALHVRWVATLEAMTPEEWSRTYVHPDSGRHTLDGLLAVYSWHGPHHIAHITGLRRRQGW